MARRVGRIKAGVIKKIAKRTPMPSYCYISSAEVKRIRDLSAKGGTKAEIMRLTGRSKSAVSLHLKRQAQKVGRKPFITKRVFGKLHTALLQLQRKAKAEKEITVAMVIAKAGVIAGERCVLDAFHKHGIYFKPLPTSPICCPRGTWRNDLVGASSTRAGVNRHGRRTPMQSSTTRTTLSRSTRLGDLRVHGAWSEVATTGEATSVRHGWLKRSLRRSSRSRAFRSPPRLWVAGSGCGAMWRKGGKEAAAMYKDLAKLMKKAKPAKAARPNHRWVILEDNDPSGHKSSNGKAAKKEHKIKSLDLPPRSPQLNVLDYSLWRAINVKMWSQEKKMAANRKESAAAFRARLRRTALILPSSVVTKAVKDMRRSTQLLHKAKGGLFKE